MDAPQGQVANETQAEVKCKCEYDSRNSVAPNYNISLSLCHESAVRRLYRVHFKTFRVTFCGVLLRLYDLIWNAGCGRVGSSIWILWVGLGVL
jgi:hypothetical protein